MFWNPEAVYTVATSFCMLLLGHCAVSSQTCDELQCLNSNPCQSTASRDNTTHAQCLCGGKWAGPRCEFQLSLTAEGLTSSMVFLQLDLTMTSQRNDVKVTQRKSAVSSMVSETSEFLDVEYTMVYWRRNETVPDSPQVLDVSLPPRGDVSCVLLHKQSSRRPILQGLLPSTRYTVCVESGSVDSCLLSTFADLSSERGSTLELSTDSNSSSWPSNCASVTTASAGQSSGDFSLSTILIVASVCLIIIIVVLVVVVVGFVVRRHRLLRDLCQQRALCDGCRSECFVSCYDSCCCVTPSSDLVSFSEASNSRSKRRAHHVDETNPGVKRRWSMLLWRLRRNQKRSTDCSNDATADVQIPLQPSPPGACVDSDEVSSLSSQSPQDTSATEQSAEQEEAGAALLANQSRRFRPSRDRFRRKRKALSAYRSEDRLAAVPECPDDDVIGETDAMTLPDCPNDDDIGETDVIVMDDVQTP